MSKFIGWIYSEKKQGALRLSAYPILAHVEQYSCFTTDLKLGVEAIRQLRKDGVYIQVNSESVGSNIKKNSHRFTQELILKGLVDFIATDSHGAETRPPLLAHAKNWVAKRCGKDVAEKLLVTNAQAMLAGLDFSREPLFGNASVALRGHFMKQPRLGAILRVGTSVLVALSLVLIIVTAAANTGSVSFGSELLNLIMGRYSFGSNLTGENSTQKASEIESGVANEAAAVSDVAENTPLGEYRQEHSAYLESQYDISLNNGAESQGGGVAPKNGMPENSLTNGGLEAQATNNQTDSTTAGSGAAASTTAAIGAHNEKLSPYDLLVSNYYEHLQSLETEYVAQVGKIYIEMTEAVKNLGREEAKARFDVLMDELGRLEFQADNEVFKVLYDLQTDLEERAWDISIVQVFRNQYFDTKAEVSDKYQATLLTLLKSFQ